MITSTISGNRIISSSIAFILLSLTGLNSFSQELYPVKIPDGLWHNQQRDLRYKPDGEDFVITNGNRLFTRALYGTNTAFRVETGDRPEFALYMSGMGGNFKMGIEADGSSKWLTEANTITAIYKAGSRLYTIEDPIFGSGRLNLEVLAMADADGFIVKARFEGLEKPLILYSVFGGATGKKFTRDGDMGTDPESVFYLKAENCLDNNYTLDNGSFTLKYGSGSLAGKELTGIFPPGTAVKLADAGKQKSPQDLYQSSAGSAPAIIGKLKVLTGTDYYFAIHNPVTKPAFNYEAATGIFEHAEAARELLANRVKIKTPDPYINTIGGTLAMASDAVWEEPSYLHGAIGWRMRLDGWRGAYTADVLGWHDRAKMHLKSYAQSQLTSPASGPVIADTVHHLARSLEKIGVGMFTSGYITRDPLGKNPRAHHYDMNLVYIDQLLRHYAWTGDISFLKETWPVIKRHLEWETRNFDPDRDGLYDAYAAIWASDALQYSGGDVTHTSAYNFYAYSKAAEIAALMGEDPSPYRKESEKILKAMNTILWMPDRGSYAEFKDALGNRLLHPAAALWTIYHSMDSKTMDPFQAYQSMRYIDNEIPHIPVRANGLEDKGYYTISTTSWMPYIWSLNDVALAESMHTALANWQAGRTDEAFKLFKSEILAYMYLGGSPGNVGQISYYNGSEKYRDFADPVGMFSRALVEGLFGIVPDALNKTFTIRPGLPSDWDYASFSQPDISFDFMRNGKTDSYQIVPGFPEKLDLKFQVIAQGQVKRITVNGKSYDWKNISASVGKPIIEINAPASDKYVINITWKGAKPVMPSAEKTYVAGDFLTENIPGAIVLKVYDPQNALTDIRTGSFGFTAKVNSEKGSHTAFVQLQQGALSWWMPVCFRVEQAITLLPLNGNEASNQSFRLLNTTSADLSASVTVNSFNTSLNISAGKVSDVINVPKGDLITGTNSVTIRLQDGKTVTGCLTDWTANTQKKLDLIDLSDYFNDKVTQIFRNKYLTPRPQVTTLQLPWQGVGDWPGSLVTYNIDDRGLRKVAGDENRIDLPQGISFFTPGTEGENNILFTSQWDNYPKEFSIPLSGNASHAWFLMAGSTNPMQSQLDNGVLVVEYTDGTMDSLSLRNPETWWPIQEDYYTDGFAFRLKQARPIRIHLKSGEIIIPDGISIAKYNGKKIDGGAATVLDMILDPSKTLKKITLKTIANDVVIGLMGMTLAREPDDFQQPTPPRVTIKLPNGRAAEIPKGPYKPSWESMKENYKTPEWLMDAKFGIFIHYGVYTVAAYASEWYPRHMYSNAGVQKWHTEHFGPVDKFGYKDFIPLFTMEKFDPAEWAELFKKAGARYVIPTAEHHDGFAMYDSRLTKWNSKNMGPKRDFIGELGDAVRKQGMKFGVSDHRMEHWDFMYPMLNVKTDLFDPEYADFYGPPQRPQQAKTPAGSSDIKIPPDDAPQSQAFLEEWLARCQEIIDKYRPDALYFDNGVNSRNLDSIKLRLAAYYYNRAASWKKQVTIVTKSDAYLAGSLKDYERQGRAPKDLTEYYWQVDDPVGEKFGYVEGMKLSNAGAVVNRIIENASKNGNYMLNISPKSDGTIPDEQRQILLGVGKWLDINGDGIYGTRSWTRYGEGQFRFTTKGDVLYAISLKWSDQPVLISLVSTEIMNVKSIQMLGHTGQIPFTQDEKGLRITFPSDKPCEFAYTFKIEGSGLKK